MGDRYALTAPQWPQFHLLWVALGALYGTIEATSLLMEADRFRTPLPVWQAFVNELTGVGTLVALIPLLRWFDDRYAFRRDALRRAFVAHLLFSVPFALLHIAVFITLRLAIYPLFGARYDETDDPLLGFLYEYRKLMVGYIVVLGSMYGWRHYWQLQRLLAMPEADTEIPAEPDHDQLIAPQSTAPAATAQPTRQPLRFVARANHREYLVAADTVDYIEAAGNYSVLHAPGGPFRLRQTIAALEQSLDSTQFVRVHRSFVVRVDVIREIQPWFHGDKKLVLTTGAVINLSRRYRERVESLHAAPSAVAPGTSTAATK